MTQPKALLFDVFGTVVDWRGSVIRRLEDFGAKHGLAPADCMMCAAHNDDLAAAQALGFQTAFICRPKEHGPGQSKGLAPTGDWTHAVESMTELADALGC